MKKKNKANETIIEEEIIVINEHSRGRSADEGEFAEEEEEFVPSVVAEPDNEELAADSVEIAAQGAESVDSNGSGEEETAAVDENLITAVDEIESAIESIIFAAPQAISLAKIKNLLKAAGYSTESAGDIIKSLQQTYEDKGIQLVRIAGGFQFRSHPKNSNVLSRMLEDKPAKLSRSALEVLAIIAYKQPVTRAEIDTIRGIDSGHLMRGLMEKNLVRTSGHAETPGRPFLYGTTPYFQEVFSLGSLDDLPSLEDTGRELGDSDTLQTEADYYDRSSPLAAEPDRGDFDEPAEDENVLPDFSGDANEEAGVTN